MIESPLAATDCLLAAVDRGAAGMCALLRALVRAPSVNPPGDTRAAAAIAQEYATAGGLSARRIGATADRPSVIAEYRPPSLRADAPRLLLLSHLDTVPLGQSGAWSVDPFGAEEHDGSLFGRGAADAKGSAAAMLLALRALDECGASLQGSVAVALVADEETGGAGARDLLARGLLAADAVVVGETTDNQVAVAEKGVAWFRLVVHGRTAHASVPHAGVNAASHLVRWLARIDEQLVPRLGERHHPLVSPPSLSLTSLAGGVAPNVIPDRCEAVLDRRTLPGESLDAARDELLVHAAPLQDRDPAARFDVEVLVWAEPFETAPSTPLVRAALTARRALGLPAACVGYQQASDGRFFGARGIPTLVLGPGVAEQTHVPDESVPLAQVVEAAKLHALTAWHLLSGSGAGRTR